LILTSSVCVPARHQLLQMETLRRLKKCKRRVNSNIYHRTKKLRSRKLLAYNSGKPYGEPVAIKEEETARKNHRLSEL